MEAELIQRIAVYAIPLIFAITLHEAAHAYAAKQCGDATAYLLGRMTLNPLKHIDPLWTIAIPLLTLLLSPFVFGAAKPVPVNFAGLRHPRRDMVWVAAAGPLANLAMMVAWAVFGKLVLVAVAGKAYSAPIEFLLRMAEAGIFVNALLMVFNLFPLPPLDGGRILAGLLPGPLAYKFSRVEPYGMLILVGLLLTGVLSAFLVPLVSMSMNTIYAIIGLS